MNARAVEAGAMEANADRGGPAMLLAGMLVLALLAATNVAHGETNLSLAQVLSALTRDADPLLRDMVRDFRLPRAVVGLLGGAALGVSGALLQSVLRNPMVSPGILGISAGSHLFIVLATVFAPWLLNLAPLPLTLAGGWMAVAMVWLLAGGRRASPLRIVLAGLIVSMTLGGITSAALVMNETEARFLLAWSGGMLRQNGWNGASFAWPWILGCLALVMLTARQLDLSMLGEETARALGQRTRLVVLACLGAVLVLTGVVVAVAGPIGFVGLVAPHLVKLAGIRRHAMLLPASAIWGAALLLGADTLTHVFGSLTRTPPVGAITAAIGAPWLLWLVLRGRRHGAGFAPMTPFGVRPRPLLPWPLTAGLLGLGVLGTLLLGLTVVGGLPLSPGTVLAALAGEGSAVAQRIVLEFRLPRILAALLAGACFAVAGALIQGALRNPLADASVIGVNAGAGAGVLLLLAVWPLAAGPVVSAAALAGGLAAAAAIYGLAWRRRLMPAILILTGIAVGAICGAIVQILVLDGRFTGSPLVWLIGGLHARGWPAVQVLAPALALLLPLGLLLARRVEVLAFDDLTAGSLGLDVGRTRLGAGLVGVALAAIAVSQTGPIGYVGLVAPHAARLLTGHRMRPLLLLAGLIGAILLGLADIAARLVVRPAEIPAGAVVALIGAPYLLYLIHRSDRS
nr:iron ABC transporter permease [uncultured Roseococcus sp.]